jgi:hypothetical protein
MAEKNKGRPEILYKYRSLSKSKFESTRDIFLKNELYFPHPDQINDPFDCKIPPSWENITKENILTHIGKSKNYGIDSAKINLAINNVKCNSLETSVKAMREENDKGHLRNVGVLSLSEKWLDILMWSHYANSHKGICIGFDYTKLFFIFNGKPLWAVDIKYPESNQYPKRDYLDDPDTRVKLYLTKSLDWKYEKEWRIIFPEKGRTVQKFEPDAIVSVHLGCQISKEDKETVINWCLQRKPKPKIYETTKDKSSYSLKENEITY